MYMYNLYTCMYTYMSTVMTNLKICKKSNFDLNQLKISTCTLYLFEKNYKNGEFSPSHF